MNDRFSLNHRKRSGDPKEALAQAEAKRQLDAGVRCDDCAALHDYRKAVAFVTLKAPRGTEDVDYFVSFLCEFHADIFVAKNVTPKQTKITAPKSKAELTITDIDIKVN